MGAWGWGRCYLSAQESCPSLSFFFFYLSFLLVQTASHSRSCPSKSMTYSHSFPGSCDSVLDNEALGGFKIDLIVWWKEMDTTRGQIHHHTLCLPPPTPTGTFCHWRNLEKPVIPIPWRSYFLSMRQVASLQKKGNVLRMEEQKDGKNLAPDDTVWATDSTLGWTNPRLPFT